MVVEVKNIEELERYLEAYKMLGKTVFVEFASDWHAESKIMKSCFRNMKSRYTDSVYFTIDITGCSDVIDYYKIYYFPTYVVFFDGLEVDRLENGEGQKLLPFVMKHNVRHGRVRGMSVDFGMPIVSW